MGKSRVEENEGKLLQVEGLLGSSSSSDGEENENQLALNRALRETLSSEPTPRVEGVMLARIQAIRPDGQVEVTWENFERPVTALSTIPFSQDDIGAQVALLFQGGDPSRPVIMGKIIGSQAPTQPTVEIVQDSERISLNAKERIELKCGDASITLTKAGKIIIKGKYVVSHSAGVNRIRGGSIHLN